jgi:hypothetical protein
VEVAGVFTGQSAVATDRVAVHPAKPAGLADATPLSNVLQDRFDFLDCEPGAEENRALTLGKSSLAGATTEHTARLLGTVSAGHCQVFCPSLAVVGALRIQATESREVVHDATPLKHPQGGKRLVTSPSNTPTTSRRAIDLGHEVTSDPRSKSKGTISQMPSRIQVNLPVVQPNRQMVKPTIAESKYKSGQLCNRRLIRDILRLDWVVIARDPRCQLDKIHSPQ